MLLPTATRMFVAEPETIDLADDQLSPRTAALNAAARTVLDARPS